MSAQHSGGQRPPSLASQTTPARPIAISPARVKSRPGLSGLLAHLIVIVNALRPRQWTKNGLVLLALVFARRLGDPTSRLQALLACLAFILAASATYLINDIADREADRLHPRKRSRPIAAGLLPVCEAVAIAVGLVVGAALLTWLLLAWVPPSAGHVLADPFRHVGGSSLLFVLALASYVALTLSYSLWLKHLVLWDVCAIAAGFVLRALAGAFAIAVQISPWFFLCTTFLALLLALGKRRAELVSLEALAGDHRRNLNAYTLPLLDQLLAIVVTCALITYSLYTFQGEASNHAMMLTIPCVLFGVFRYLYLLYVRGEGERPDELLWRDPQILGAVVVCLAVMFAVLYLPIFAA